MATPVKKKKKTIASEHERPAHMVDVVTRELLSIVPAAPGWWAHYVGFEHDPLWGAMEEDYSFPVEMWGVYRVTRTGSVSSPAHNEIIGLVFFENDTQPLFENVHSGDLYPAHDGPILFDARFVGYSSDENDLVHASDDPPPEKRPPEPGPAAPMVSGWAHYTCPRCGHADLGEWRLAPGASVDVLFCVCGYPTATRETPR